MTPEQRRERHRAHQRAYHQSEKGKQTARKHRARRRERRDKRPEYPPVSESKRKEIMRLSATGRDLWTIAIALSIPVSRVQRVLEEHKKEKENDEKVQN